MTTDRAALLNKTFKVLKKHYKPVAPHSSYTVLEHLLFACCLEGAKYEAAEEGYAILQQKYFDWNEVRVTAIGELAEVLSAVPDSADAAKRVRGVLQSLFEKHYSFDFEFIRKQNQGTSVKELSQHRRITPFVVNYLVQCGLGGHAIPLSDGAFEVLYVVGAISEKDLAAKKAPGLERTISKKQGVEFGSLLHQLAIDYSGSRHSTRVRAILTEIAPDCKDRLPKRGGAKKTVAKPAAKTKKPAASEKPADKAPAKAKATKATTTKKAASKKAAAKPAPKPAPKAAKPASKSASKTTPKKAVKKAGKKPTKKPVKKVKTSKKPAKKAAKKSAPTKKKTSGSKSSRIKKPR